MTLHFQRAFHLLGAVGLAVALSVLAPPPAAAQGGLQKFVADVAIQGAFQNALGRAATPVELRRYRVRVFEDHWTQQDIEDDLVGRDDYRRHQSYRDREPRDRRRAWVDDRGVDDMIRHAYREVLGRDPDPEGLRNYRREVLDKGWTEQDVREALRESQEHRANPTAATDRMIAHAYREVLGRDPDPGGLYEYRNQIMHHGWEEHDVAQALRNSPEYRQKNTISRTQAEAIVRRAYLSVLGREPDPASQTYVDRVLRDHWGEREVARELRNSDEFRNRGR